MCVVRSGEAKRFADESDAYPLMLMAWKLLEGDEIIGSGVIACD
jgi:hypothetical protein